MNTEILRIVDTIHRDKDIDKEVIFLGIESALKTAAKKRLGQDADINITIDRETGDITATLAGNVLAPKELGRIAALNAKQIIMQKIREAERDVVFAEFSGKIGSIMTGTVMRIEGSNIIVNVAKTEAVLPRKEQVYSESYQLGDRMKFYVHDVKKVGSKVSIELSRANPELIRLLFHIEIPEISENIIEIRGLAREPGYRAKIAVHTEDSKIDAVGACVGVRGSRIKSIVDELGGEKIDIVRWSPDPAEFIIEALKPAEITEITLDEEEQRAQVLVREDSLSKAIGKRGKNVRLASRLTGWEIDIVSPEGSEKTLEELVKENEVETTAPDAAAPDAPPPDKAQNPVPELEPTPDAAPQTAGEAVPPVEPK
jgi:N utilization substance protein A